MSAAAEVLPEEKTPAAPSAAPDARLKPDLPETVIERRPGWQLVDLREIWRFRELLFFLTWRDV
ncbi:MAG TPA: hypothetical protein VH208_13480, partial [Myxococcaceae bacterium]|nr:hypothetical protein [Myxococcaceae bacterium]